MGAQLAQPSAATRTSQKIRTADETAAYFSRNLLKGSSLSEVVIQGHTLKPFDYDAVLERTRKSQKLPCPDQSKGPISRTLNRPYKVKHGKENSKRENHSLN